VNRVKTLSINAGVFESVRIFSKQTSNGNQESTTDGPATFVMVQHGLVHFSAVCYNDTLPHHMQTVGERIKEKLAQIRRDPVWNPEIMDAFEVCGDVCYAAPAGNDESMSDLENLVNSSGEEEGGDISDTGVGEEASEIDKYGPEVDWQNMAPMPKPSARKKLVASAAGPRRKATQGNVDVGADSAPMVARAMPSEDSPHPRAALERDCILLAEEWYNRWSLSFLGLFLDWFPSLLEI
jgi:hypothetical protein